MLVLTRETKESIRIDGPCELTVLRIVGNKVRLGFTADKSTTIMRTEIIDRDKPERE